MKTTKSLADKLFVAVKIFVFLFIVCLSNIHAQNNEIFTITTDALQDEKGVALSKAGWKYHVGDDSAWANPQFDDSAWEKLDETFIKPDLLESPDWHGRGWFRLHFKVDENLADKIFALIAGQRGATEIYLDGKKLAPFGEITDSEITEYNPAALPIPFHFEKNGEHLLAVRFASEAFADPLSLKAKWMINGGIYPGFTYNLKDADDVQSFISQYSDSHSMRGGFLFIGILLALSLLHFLLYIFYRVERGNLFYSIYAAAFAFFILCGNYLAAGHQPIFPSLVISQISKVLFAFVFVSLLTFLHIAFGRRFGKLFWILTALWAVKTIFSLEAVMNY